MSTPSDVRATGNGTVTPASANRSSIANSLSGQPRPNTARPWRVFFAAARRSRLFPNRAALAIAAVVHEVGGALEAERLQLAFVAHTARAVALVRQ